MDALFLLVAVLIGYVLMYRLYGRFLSKRIFNVDAHRIAPSKEFEDGLDYVPTRKEIIFGHHFTSIAGTGPIVGPALAIIWGWVPAVVWVFFGSVFMGAVHDFGSLLISMRNQGKSISEYTAKYISPRTRLLFFLVVFLELWIVIAIFGLVIAVIFKIFPVSVIPVWFQIVIAVLLGRYISRTTQSITLATVIAVFFMFLSVVLGVYFPIEMPVILGFPATGSWTVLLLIYAFVASVLPVTTLLQPRDYINAYQLIVTMVLLIAGIVSSAFLGGLEFVAPAVQLHPAEAPSMLPFLFITIACGAISGFHSLVASGTSSKQVASEADGLFVGYGSMVTEGVLAIIVIIAVAAGIGMGVEVNGVHLAGFEAWNESYKSWTAMSGLGSKLGAFVNGSANMMTTTGLPRDWALAIMGVFVASFAGTTLDTATRIQRYVTTEVFESFGIPAFKNMYVATLFAVVTAALLAFAAGPTGSGAQTLWPLFGAVNQTLAALALIVITAYLRRQGGNKWLVAGLPALFMYVVTLWACVENQLNFWAGQQWLLSVVNIIVIVIILLIGSEGGRRIFGKQMQVS